MTAPDPLVGRVAIVTGAGRGIGRAIALALAEAGASVALAGRNEGALRGLVEEITALDREALALPADVTDTDQVEALVARTVEGLGGLDILVNNAGVLVVRPLLETTDGDWDTVLDTNLRGTFLCTRSAGRVLTEQGSGKVINIASHVGIVGMASVVSYCASKAGVIQLTKALAVEWAPFGVQVNAIAPGYVETDMNAEVRAQPEVLERVLRRIPAGRMGRPAELGPLAVLLASSASDFITGETVVIDGGQIAW
ncbi:MAG: 3-oxoacyl-ACP reductase FabG [Actinomycetia bacterium]|nr:3-oxoacyl-ACP reductase FabG [Actinomycetes bacterium]